MERNKTEIVIDEMIAFGEGKGGGQVVDESYSAVADSVAEEQVPDEVPAKKAKKIIKSKAEEVADDIPF